MRRHYFAHSPKPLKKEEPVASWGSGGAPQPAIGSAGLIYLAPESSLYGFCFDESHGFYSSQLNPRIALWKMRSMASSVSTPWSLRPWITPSRTIMVVGVD